MLQLPATPKDFWTECVIPGLAMLPMKMGTVEAQVMLIAIALQESELAIRHQRVQGKPDAKGPARGLLQFEKGTPKSRGGIWGVYLHQSSSGTLKDVCDARGIAFDADSIYAGVEADDVFAVAVARLLMWTDSKPLPKVGDTMGAWECYERIWRPGKPKPAKWPRNHAVAVTTIDRRRL